MARDNLTIEGEPSPRFRVMLNGIMQDGGFATIEEAKASAKRLDLHVQIFDGRKLVFGKPLPWREPRRGERKPEGRG